MGEVNIDQKPNTASHNPYWKSVSLFSHPATHFFFGCISRSIAERLDLRIVTKLTLVLD